MKETLKMKNYLKTILLALALLIPTKAHATPPVLCGGAPSDQTFDVSGDWSYAWQDRSNPTEILHGRMHLTTCAGFVTGSLGVPVEITDPNQIASWNWPVLGTENGLVVMLMTANPNGTPWFFELQQTIATASMSGETFAGTTHTDRNVLFKANNFSGQGVRGQVHGMPTPCPDALTPIPNVSGNYHYQWGTGWSGTAVINQSGPWLWGTIGLPVEVTDPWLIANWYWPFTGGMVLSNWQIRIMSEGGTGFGDPWLYVLPLSSFMPLAFNGTPVTGGGAYATTCFVRESNISITHQ